MDHPAPNANPDIGCRGELLRSLGRLVRGLSALFWGLPVSLIICAETAKAEWLRPLGLMPAFATTALLLYGLWQMSDFQKQERPWRNALDRAKLLGLVNFGFCPFLYWQNRMPDQPFFAAAVFVLVLSAVLFLFNLNVVLKQLGAMLPDETLRQETRQFTLLNRWLLVVFLFIAAAYVVLIYSPPLSQEPGGFANWLDHLGLWSLTFFALFPLAMTMALIWKTKEVILDSVFGAK
jgi:magnesium-transporting ATPase (P-type)